MPRGNDAKEKKRPGPPRRRTFYTGIGFAISSKLHTQIKEIAFTKRLRIEDIYTEAATLLLERRTKRQIIYLAAPQPGFATRINVKMHDDIRSKARNAAIEDGYRLNDFFETAARAYLEGHDSLADIKDR